MLLRSRCEGVPGSNAPVRCAPLHGSPGIQRTCSHRRRPRCRHSPRSARTPLRVPVASERSESTQQSAPVGVYVYTDHAAILTAVDRTLTLRPSLGQFSSDRLTRAFGRPGGPRCLSWDSPTRFGKLHPGWAGSSVAEQGTFNPRVEGSIPSRLTEVAACTREITATMTRASHNLPPSSRGLGFRPFKAAARVRIPLGARTG
jgi:hypothetical protein